MELKPITRQEQIIAGKALQPITRMEKFLEEYGGASSWNDLKDKPFYAETEVILEKQVISGFTDDTRGNGTVTVYFDLDLTAGETVTVFFDGNTYEMPVVQHDVVPNMVYINDEAVCPVTIQHMTTTNKTVIVASSDLSTSHEIGIYRETVHKLDAKYLPGVAIKDISDAVINSQFDFTAAGAGMYFSSASILFRYKTLDADWNEVGTNNTNESGLFVVSFTHDNGWSVRSLATLNQYVFFEGAGFDGTYDECWRTPMIVAGQEQN